MECSEGWGASEVISNRKKSRKPSIATVLSWSLRQRAERLTMAARLRTQLDMAQQKSVRILLMSSSRPTKKSGRKAKQVALEMLKTLV